jgi:hypothetical protein
MKFEFTWVKKLYRQMPRSKNFIPGNMKFTIWDIEGIWLKVCVCVCKCACVCSGKKKKREGKLPFTCERDNIVKET